MKTYTEAIEDLAARELEAMLTLDEREWWNASYGRKYYAACADEIAAIYTDDFDRMKVAGDVDEARSRMRAEALAMAAEVMEG